MENDSYTDSEGDEENQNGVSCRAIFEILSNLILIFSASFGISNVHRWFGKVGCSLLFFKGFFGSLSLLDKCPDYVTLLYEEIALLCSALVIPLLCAEVCSEGGQQLKTVLIHLLYPLLQVGLDMFVDWPLEAHMIDISIALSVVVMSSFALSLRNLYGVMLACVYQISLCFMRKTRFDLSNLFVSLTCFHLLPNTLKSFQNSIQNKL